MIPFISEDYCGPCYGATDYLVKCCNTCQQLKLQFMKVNKPIKFAESSEQCLRENQLNERKQYDYGCHIRGTLGVPKVKGNVHIAAGAADQHQTEHSRHIHKLSSLQEARQYNSSHQINYLSFGQSYPGIINPLDGHKFISSEGGIQVNYFLQVVPTSYRTSDGEIITTNQFSVYDVYHWNSDKQFVLPGVFFYI